MLLPIPGEPPISTIEPGTTPPPSTRSSSVAAGGHSLPRPSPRPRTAEPGRARPRAPTPVGAPAAQLRRRAPASLFLDQRVPLPAAGAAAHPARRSAAAGGAGEGDASFDILSPAVRTGRPDAVAPRGARPPSWQPVPGANPADRCPRFMPRGPDLTRRKFVARSTPGRRGACAIATSAAAAHSRRRHAPAVPDRRLAALERRRGLPAPPFTDADYWRFADWLAPYFDGLWIPDKSLLRLGQQRRRPHLPQLRCCSRRTPSPRSPATTGPCRQRRPRARARAAAVRLTSLERARRRPSPTPSSTRRAGSRAWARATPRWTSRSTPRSPRP